MHFVQSVILLCIDLTFFFSHSLILSSRVCVRVRTHGCGSSGFQTDVEWQHLKRAGDLGQWATHISCNHLRWVSLSYPFCLLFSPDLSITNSASCRNRVTGGPCKRSSEIDRQVRKLIVVQDTSAEAKRYSSYTLPASPPLHHPASLWGALPHSLAPKCLFLPRSCPWKAGISLAAWEKFPQYWFTISNTSFKRRGLPSQLQRMLLASPHIN